MLFCFSGTGNSLHVAQIVAKELQEEVIMMTQQEREKKKKYILEPNEKVGFIFPIYWWGMPVLVEDFIKELVLINYKDNYTYAIATFGIKDHNGMHDLERILKKKSMNLQAKYEVKMVDNYIVGYEIIAEEKQKRILLEADKKITEIVDKIQEGQKGAIGDLLSTTLKPLVHSMYKHTDHHKKFYVTSTCIGCGICENECPCNVIQWKGNKPIWEENCSFCLKCINTCPKQAIQYGSKTEKRKRYLYKE